MIEMSYRQDQTVQCPADHFVLYYHKVKRVRLHGFTVLFTGITIVFIINWLAYQDVSISSFNCKLPNI